MSVDDLARAMGGTAHGFAPGVAIYGFALDSREARPGTLFVAIGGARVDGQGFVEAAMASGSAGALVTRPVDAPHVLVPRVEDALARLAATFRAGFEGTVLAITGSAGKTTTKEFLAAALVPVGPVLKNAGNRNSEYSVPLVWTELTSAHRVVVVEMAMRGLGQISHLCSFCQPKIGVVTNIGTAHLEQMGSREAVAQAKGELLEALPADGVAIVWNEDDFRQTLIDRAPCPVATFGFSEGSTCRIVHYEALGPTRCVLRGTLEGVRFEAELPTVGRHQALNAAAALMAAHAAGVKVWAAVDALAGVELPEMRMQAILVLGATVMLDAYNASPAGMAAAIETLGDLPTRGRRLAVIGEMKELGEAGPAAHREVGEALNRAGVERALFLGEGAALAMEAFEGDGALAETLEDVTAFLSMLAPGDLVLVKGSRALELERALEPLREGGK